MFGFPQRKASPFCHVFHLKLKLQVKVSPSLIYCLHQIYFFSLVVLITVVLIFKVCVFLKLTSSVYSLPTYILYDEQVGVFLTDNFCQFLSGMYFYCLNILLDLHISDKVRHVHGGKAVDFSGYFKGTLTTAHTN